MASGAAIWLALVCLAELLILSWCALWPLKDELPRLLELSGWRELGSFTLGNLDVLVLGALRSMVLWLLVLGAPCSRGRPGAWSCCWGASPSGNHGKVRTAISVLCGAHAIFLLVKAAAVAVTAPGDTWPQPRQPVEPQSPDTAGDSSGSVTGSGGGAGYGGGGEAEGFSGLYPYSYTADGGYVAWVGLAYMYISIVASILTSLLDASLASAAVTAREAAWEADLDVLRAPLLGAEEGQAAGPGGKGQQQQQGQEGAGGKDKGTQGKKEQQHTVWELLRLSAPDTPLLLCGFSAGVVAALGAALIPYLTGQIIDYASIDPDKERFTHRTLQLLGVAALTGLFTGTRGGIFTVANTRLNVRLRKALFHSLLSFEIGFFDTTKTGEITSRLAADTATVADQVGLNMNVMLRSMTQAAMVLVFMFSSSWRLTVVTFILIPVVMVISKVYGRYYSKLAKKVQAALAEANGVAEEVLSTMTTVKAHAAQDSAEAAYAAKLHGFYKLQLAEAGIYALYAMINTFLPNLVSATVLFYGGHLVLSKMMSPGALVGFMLYQQSLSSAFQTMGDVFSSLTAAVGAADKVIELMKRKPAISPGGSLVLPALAGHVALHDVVFHYPARPDVRVLCGLSLEAQPGQVVALVGPSGGGKSSIVKLLERFYVPSAGHVLLDGHDLATLEPKWLRRNVALVSQEPVLYARSIRRNITFGMEAEDGCPNPPTDEEIEEAARQANAHDFICGFPEGYDTCCGEKGVALSGGQKQRIAIARALVRRPRVLLLDEATSALDADSEAVVQEALDRVMHGRTVIVIAHRLSTVQGADRIYVVARGSVREAGSHEELLAAGGVYAQLVRRQLTRPASQVNLLASSSTDLRVSASAASLASMAEQQGQGQGHG